VKEGNGDKDAIDAAADTARLEASEVWRNFNS
jgi:hypothetical protein